MSSGKSSVGPTASHVAGGRSNTAEPIAKPSAGSVKPITATAPAPWTVRPMSRRRVTVSPSNAPGISRSLVYFDFGGVRRGWGTARKIIDARPGGAQRDIAPHGMARWAGAPT